MTFVLAVAAQSPAWAALPDALVVRGAAHACPSPETVAAALARLWPSVSITTEGGTPDALSVEIDDRGETYEVRVAGRRRMFTDSTRRCDERAKTATVFVVLTLAPPAIDAPATGPAASGPVAMPPAALVAEFSSWPPATPTSAVPAPLAGRSSGAAPFVPRSSGNGSSPASVRVEVGGALLAAPSVHAVPGGAIGCAVDGAHFGAALDVRYAATANLPLDRVGAHLSRVPVDAVLRAHRSRGRFDLAGGLGLEAAWLKVEGVGLSRPMRASRLEVGPMAAIRLAFAFGVRMEMFLSFDATYLPQSYRLVVAPAQRVGTTPNVWFGGTAGVAVDLF